MEELQLGKALRELYSQAIHGQDRVIMLYLFGIKYGEMIEEKIYQLVIFCVMHNYRIAIEVKLKKELN